LHAALVLLLAYTIGITLFGVWIGRRVRGPADFFVAGRSLTWPLVGGTVLAANIGAGTTVGAAGLAYHEGISAWWWNGAVGLGTLGLAYWAGPRLWTIASRKGHLTLGDYLEDRYSVHVRGLAAGLLMIGTLAILAGQLIAGAAILEIVAGLPRWEGVAIGGIAMTAYFTAGGLLSSAWVNAVQLVVVVAGLAIALPLAWTAVGGSAAIAAAPGVGADFWDPLYSAGAFSGWTMLLLLGPGFVITPGLVQKAYGAVDTRALRIGIGAAGLLQLAFSFLPVLLGMAARVNHPAIASQNLVLPTVMLEELPIAVGALALAAVFSAEVSTCDAILFMLATSASRDIYQRFINPSAQPDRILWTARAAAIAGGLVGMVLAVQLATIVDALRIFYAVLIATLFVPVAASLVSSRPTSRDALASMVSGIGVMLVVFFVTDRRGWWDPGFWGLVGSAVGFLASLASPKNPR
jgi:SSS family solute:Na+ symporter